MYLSLNKSKLNLSNCNYDLKLNISVQIVGNKIINITKLVRIMLINKKDIYS